MTSSEKYTAAIRVVFAVAETIRELGTVPSGVLYAGFVGKLSLEEYNAVIRLLVKSGVVTQNNFELTWVGGKVEA